MMLAATSPRVNLVSDIPSGYPVYCMVNVVKQCHQPLLVDALGFRPGISVSFTIYVCLQKVPQKLIIVDHSQQQEAVGFQSLVAGGWYRDFSLPPYMRRLGDLGCLPVCRSPTVSPAASPTLSSTF